MQNTKRKMQIVATVLLLTASTAQAGDYWIVRDQSGGIVLTNQKPKVGHTVLRHYELKDMSVEEVRAAEVRDRDFWLGLKMEERTTAIDRLAAEIAKQGARDGRGQEPPTFLSGSTTSVTVRPVIVVPKAK